MVDSLSPDRLFPSIRVMLTSRRRTLFSRYQCQTSSANNPSMVRLAQLLRLDDFAMARRRSGTECEGRPMCRRTLSLRLMRGRRGREERRSEKEREKRRLRDRRREERRHGDKHSHRSKVLYYSYHSYHLSLFILFDPLSPLGTICFLPRCFCVFSSLPLLDYIHH